MNTPGQPVVLEEKDLKLFYSFDYKDNFHRARTHKVHTLEYFQKQGQPYPYGSNEEWGVFGGLILDLMFVDFFYQIGYPSQDSEFKRTTDIIQFKQSCMNDINLAETAKNLQIPRVLQTGKQQKLKGEASILATSLKAMIAAQYFDKGSDMLKIKQLVYNIINDVISRFKENGSKKDPSESFKQKFQLFLSHNKNIKPQIQQTTTTIENQLVDQMKFKMTIKLENEDIITVEGVNKKETEEKLYEQFLAKYQNADLKKYNNPQQIQQNEDDVNDFLESLLKN